MSASEGGVPRAAHAICHSCKQKRGSSSALGYPPIRFNCGRL